MPRRRASLVPLTPLHAPPRRLAPRRCASACPQAGSRQGGTLGCAAMPTPSQSPARARRRALWLLAAAAPLLLAASLVQVRAQERKALTEASVDLRPIREKLGTLMQTQDYILQQIQSLRLQAPHDGLWHSTDIRHMEGNWVSRGKELGRVVDERSHLFLGVVKQEAALNWDRLKAQDSRVRIEGERADEHAVTQLTVVPHSQKDLPSAALTPLAGGDLAVSAQDQTGRKAVEQFFLLRAQLDSSTSQGPEAASRNGRSGWIRVQLPPRPLADRLWQTVQQFFQRRYQV